jgi:hypothetical protein
METTMNNDAREIGKMLLQMRDTIRTCPPGPEQDDMQRRFDNMIVRYRAFPSRVAMQAVFADRDEAESVLRTEMEWVFAAWEEGT